MAKTDEEKVKEIIAELLMVDDEQLTPGALLMDDLGADSLDVVELVIEVEECFDLEVADEDAEKWKTVGDVVDYVTAKGK